MTFAQKDAVNGVFANVGKAVAAYERKLEPGELRFDQYVDAVVAGDYSAARRALGDGHGWSRVGTLYRPLLLGVMGVVLGGGIRPR